MTEDDPLEDEKMEGKQIRSGRRMNGNKNKK